MTASKEQLDAWRREAELRDYPEHFAREDWKKALEGARNLNRESWDRCQAISWVARYAPDDHVLPLCREALAAADGAADSYLACYPKAWPLRALVERGYSESLNELLTPILAEAEQVAPLASRSNALFLIFQAVLPGHVAHWRPVLDALLRASRPTCHWRQKRNLRDAILLVARVSPELGVELRTRVDDVKIRQRLERQWQKGAFWKPRPYFW